MARPQSCVKAKPSPREDPRQILPSVHVHEYVCECARACVLAGREGTQEEESGWAEHSWGGGARSHLFVVVVVLIA